MKKAFKYFFLIAFCTSAAIADDAGIISRAAQTSKSQSQMVDNSTRASVSRNVAGGNTAVNSTNQEGATSRTTVSRTAPTGTEQDIGRGTNTVAARTGSSRSVVSGAASVRNEPDATSRAVGRTVRTETANVNTASDARRAGVVSRSSSAAEISARTVAAEARAVQNRAATTSAESITQATERLQQTAELNKSCQQQYNDCMDQFCAVIDANQKRCSCSSNLSRYAKVESAVKDANAQLNEVAQRIRYVGLSADEIRAIMSATEAEEVLSGTRDNSESRNMLDEIEKLIKNPSNATSYSGDTYSGLDMDLDFSSDGGDLFSLDFLGNSSSSFSNLRGTDLYNAAKKRCNSVLNQCKGAGATTQQITGNYDLAIDKDCIAYEQGLTKMNESLKTNVRSANQMLQKARLAVLQNKNQYDAKGCIAALNTCMMDDMVCGSDYTKCLDPTKRYIDENGNVVLGQRIADITDFMKDYNNAAINKEFLANSKSMTVDVANCKNAGNGSCVAKYLLEKIGTGKTVNEGGLCRAVLDKCQNFTYSQNNVYEPYNDVVVNYIQRAMVNIQASQQKIISDYASSCMVDIATCYNQQVSQVNAWSSTASVNSIYSVMRGACRNVALTCSYAVFNSYDAACPVRSDSEINETTIDCIAPGNLLTCQDKCINSVSEMFYQSLLCPENSSYRTDAQIKKDNTDSHDSDKTIDDDKNNAVETAKYVNDRCKCDTGYSVWGKTCTRQCAKGQFRNTLGICESCPIGEYWDEAYESDKCKPCPTQNDEATSTAQKGSTSLSDCKPVSSFIR